ncbi:MAG: CsbD family protein [Terriglobales bacterium]
MEAVGTGGAVAVNQASFRNGMAFLAGTCNANSNSAIVTHWLETESHFIHGMGIMSARRMMVPLFEIAQDSTIRRKQMKPSTTDEIKGTVHEVKGKVKETAGKVTNNPNLQAEGNAEKNTGKVQKKVGQIEKVFEK